MRRINALWLILTILGWLGAASTATAFPRASQQQSPPTQAEAPNPQQPEQKSESASVPAAKVTLYVYRQRRYAGSALKPSVYADDRELARMDNGRFFVVTLGPGKHTIRSNDKASGVEIEMKAGLDYYIRIDMQEGFWKGHGRLTLVLPEQGAFEVKNTKLLDDSDIKNHELVAPGAKANPEP